MISRIFQKNQPIGLVLEGSPVINDDASFYFRRFPSEFCGCCVAKPEATKKGDRSLLDFWILDVIEILLEQLD